MKSFLFLLSFICLCESIIIYNQTVVLYKDDRENIYAKFEETACNRIKNAKEFHAFPGRAYISYELLNHNIYLLSYKPLPDVKKEKDEGGYSPMYDKPLLVGVYRGKNRFKDGCTSIETVKRYRKYVELGIRLWTGNLARIDQSEDNSYISSTCLEVDESCYSNPDDLWPLESQFVEKAVTIDGEKAKNWAVRWFLVDEFGGGWLGMAAVGNPSIVVNKNSNYWLFSQDNYYGEDDPNLGRLFTLLHEYTHNLGYGHSNALEASHSGQFFHFSTIDGYEDCASYMGACGVWYSPPCMSCYKDVTVGKKPEPWQYKVVEKGKHTYRLYALDHPYSRNFLGTNEPYHEENEVIDGVEFKYHALAIEIPINKQMTDKYDGGDAYASINIEYRYTENGLRGAKANGVRITYGISHTSGFDNSLCNVLQGDVDSVGSWEDSEIPFGFLYYPYHINTGTLTFQIKKIHRSPLSIQIEDAIIQDNKRGYKEAPYVDIEINYNPGVKQNIPNGVVKPITVKFSPSWFNCKRKDDTYGYECQRAESTGSGWGYVEDEPERVNTPRIYNNQIQYYRSVYGFRSYSGKQTLLWTLCYGTSGKICPRMDIQDAKLTDINIKVYPFADVKRIKNEFNSTEEDYKNGIVIYGEGITVPEGENIYITDLFYGEERLSVKDGKFFTVLPDLESEGLGEGAVVIKDKSGTVVSYKSFTICRNTNSDRIAVTKTDSAYNIGVAAIDPKRFTTASMIIKQTIHGGSWLLYPIMDLEYNDYIYIDFGGSIPSDLTMTIEVDNGYFVVDLKELEGHNGVSYKLSYIDLNNKMGCLCNIYKFRFSKTIEIVNIRPVFETQIGNQIQKFDVQKATIDYDGYKYNIETKATGDKFEFKSFNREINGKTYSFNSISSSYSDISIKPNNSSIGKSTTIVIIAISAGVLLLLIICCYCYMKKKKRSAVSRTYNMNPAFNPPSQHPPVVYPGYPGTMPPVRGNAGTMPPGGYAASMPPSRGYAGGYRR